MNKFSFAFCFCTLFPCLSPLKPLSTQTDSINDNSYKTILFLDENIKILQAGFWGSCCYYDTLGNEYLSNGTCLVNQTNSDDRFFDNRIFVFSSPWESEICNVIIGKNGTDYALMNTGLILLKSSIMILDSKSYFTSDRTIRWGGVKMSLDSFANYVVANVSLEKSGSGLDYRNFDIINECFYNYLPAHNIDEEKEILIYDDNLQAETNLYDRYSLIRDLYNSDKKLSKNNLSIAYYIGIVLGSLILLVIIYLLFIYVWNRCRKKKKTI